jgi:hypothetical protein
VTVNRLSLVKLLPQCPSSDASNKDGLLYAIPQHVSSSVIQPFLKAYSTASVREPTRNLLKMLLK